MKVREDLEEIGASHRVGTVTRHGGRGQQRQALRPAELRPGLAPDPPGVPLDLPGRRCVERGRRRRRRTSRPPPGSRRDLEEIEVALEEKRAELRDHREVQQPLAEPVEDLVVAAEGDTDLERPVRTLAPVTRQPAHDLLDEAIEHRASGARPLRQVPVREAERDGVRRRVRARPPEPEDGERAEHDQDPSGADGSPWHRSFRSRVGKQ